MRRWMFGTLGLVSVLVGCKGEFEQTPGNMQVTLALGQGGLELLEVSQVGVLPNPPVLEESVRFVFTPSNGADGTDGAVRDGRIVRSEFDRAGQPDPRRVVAGVGVFDVRVPALAGRLELLNAEGVTLGAVDVDPDAPVTQKMALLRDGDVLGGPVKIVDHGDSSNKVDLLFLPEGYTEAQMAQFHAHVDAIVAQMSTHSGYREHWSGFNIWRQDVQSRTVGTGTGGRPNDTAFDTASGVSGLERCVFFTNPAGIEAARRLGRAVGAEATIVLANSTDHGGCATDGLVVSARPRWVADVVSHELGHALFGLADEYESPRGGGYCSTGPNVAISSRLEALPWASMVNTNELPTPPTASFGTIGAFEGGGYCTQGRFRPTHNCMMRTLGTGMCPVCREEVARTMATLAPSEEAEGSYDVTNQTGAALWVRCDGPARSTCSDWTFVEEEATVEVQSPDGRLVLHNVDIEAPVEFDFMRVTAASKAVTLYANAADPLRQGAGPSTGPALRAPGGLSPDLGYVQEPEVELAWNAVAAADHYRVVVEVEDGVAWRLFDERQTTQTSQAIVLPAADARYRWRVGACNTSGCVMSLGAIFTANLAEDVDPPVVSGSVPAVPSDFSPAHEASVSGGTVRLSWRSAEAATYNVSVRVLNASTNTWLEHRRRDGHTSSSLDVALTVPDAWYAWTVQGCNAQGCSEWSEYSLLYGRP